MVVLCHQCVRACACVCVHVRVCASPTSALILLDCFTLVLLVFLCAQILPLPFIETQVGSPVDGLIHSVTATCPETAVSVPQLSFRHAVCGFKEDMPARPVTDAAEKLMQLYTTLLVN